MDPADLAQLFSDASRIAEQFSTGIDGFDPAEQNVLSALSLVFPGSRLTAATASADNRDIGSTRQWGMMSVRRYALVLGKIYWTLSGPIAKDSLKEQAIQGLHELIRRFGREQDAGPVRVDILQSFPVDKRDPAVVRAYDLLYARHQAAVAAKQLQGDTPSAPGRPGPRL